MLDIKLITENTESIRDSIRKRGVNADLDTLLNLYTTRKSLMLNVENQRAESNQIAKIIPQSHGEEKQELINKGRTLNHKIAMLEEELRKIDELYNEAMLNIPNLLADDTPPGESDAENVVLRTHLVPREFDFVPKDHIEIGKALDLIDFDSGTKVTGAKFYFLKNEAVLLELALKLFAMKIAAEFGYTTLITPDLAKKSILTGTGFSPRGEESNIYNLEDLDLSLIATAEITVGGMHADEIVDENKLPLKYVAESHCFRREAGAGGRESKGLYRVHQFSKIELFQITRPEDGEAALEEILKIEETIYQKLQLPYRVVRICAGDLGAAAFKKYDIEAWMPGRDSDEKYGEVTSASNCTDFQSRRLNIRYRDKENKRVYPYTLNGTAIALSRTLMAILENYQQKDGSVVIPEVLRTYIGKDIIGR
ncbi:serine--tRNA ligase [Legionella fairfieldensis]|uniref:serine--tRNA ligase n=1 Tax=Legionella fairfieldensis TaxID=45064 RepID=UPI00048C534C|nr:serine--tRNA ligase [Legionella fairfieldensis]